MKSLILASLLVLGVVSAIELDQRKPYYVEFHVQLNDEETGKVLLEVHPEWAPRGAARFHKLVQDGFYSNIKFFRVLSGFMAQFGISGDPNQAALWKDRNLKDDPVVMSNKRGYLTYATAGPNTRTTQMFINFADNAFLDSQGFAPFARVVKGMDVVDRINDRHGESPDQSLIQMQGNIYLDNAFPDLSFIKSARIVAKPDL